MRLVTAGRLEIVRHTVEVIFMDSKPLLHLIVLVAPPPRLLSANADKDENRLCITFSRKVSQFLPLLPGKGCCVIDKAAARYQYPCRPPLCFFVYKYPLCVGYHFPVQINTLLVGYAVRVNNRDVLDFRDCLGQSGLAGERDTSQEIQL